jgi:tetratricopeptide (TPR) repeat protein
MPVSSTQKKAAFAAALAAALGGGLYWKLRDPPAPPQDAGPVPLARLTFDQLGPLSPHDRDVLTSAEALFRDGRYAEAVDRLKRFEAREGDGHLRAALVAGRCLLNLDRHAEAEQAFLYVLDKRPDEPDAHRGLATVYGFLGATAREEAHLKRVADLDPTDYKPLMVLATNYVDLKVYGAAEAAAREGLRRRPADPAAEGVLRRDLAEALLGDKKAAEALEALADDNAPAARGIRAECLRMVNRPADAAREIAAGLADPDADPKAKARLLQQRGWVLTEQRDDAGAAKAFAESLTYDEHNLGTRLQLALAYRRLGDAARADAEEAKFKDSEQKLKKLSELNHEAVERPWDGAIRRELAAAYRALNLTALADHWLKAAAACDAAKK